MDPEKVLRNIWTWTSAKALKDIGPDSVASSVQTAFFHGAMRGDYEKEALLGDLLHTWKYRSLLKLRSGYVGGATPFCGFSGHFMYPAVVIFHDGRGWYLWCIVDLLWVADVFWRCCIAPHWQVANRVCVHGGTDVSWRFPIFTYGWPGIPLYRRGARFGRRHYSARYSVLYPCTAQKWFWFKQDSFTYLGFKRGLLPA